MILDKKVTNLLSNYEENWSAPIYETKQDGTELEILTLK